MKTLFISLVALFLAFFLGCQSSITDPTEMESTKFLGSTDEETFVYKDVFNFTYPNVIKLSGSIYDPSHRLNSFAEIEGVVRFGIKEVESDFLIDESLSAYKTSTTGTSPNKELKVDLYIDAVLKANCPGHDLPWYVKKATDQIVDINAANQSVVYIKKAIRVKNTCCAPLNLVLKFAVFEKKLELVSMALELVYGNPPINSLE